MQLTTLQRDGFRHYYKSQTRLTCSPLQLGRFRSDFAAIEGRSSIASPNLAQGTILSSTCRSVSGYILFFSAIQLLLVSMTRTSLLIETSGRIFRMLPSTVVAQMSVGSAGVLLSISLITIFLTAREINDVYKEVLQDLSEWKVRISLSTAVIFLAHLRSR